MKKRIIGLVVLILCFTLCLSLVACGDEEAEPTYYSVTFNSNGGSEVSTISELEQGSLVIKPTDPTKTGYDFVAWFSDEDLTEQWFFTQNPILTDLTLYAKWEAKEVVVHPTTYTVTFEVNDGSSVDAISDLTSGSLITKPTDPTKSGYTFEGWYSDEALTEPWYFTQNVVLSDLTLYAKWEAVEVIVAPVTYTVTFEVNGGSDVTAISDITNGSLIAKPTNPTKIDYEFVGWYSDETLTEPWYFTQNLVLNDLTLYAKWEVIVVPATYTVTFETNGGSTIHKMIDLPYGSYIEKPIDPTKSNNSFEGWYSDQALTEPWYFTQNSVIKNVILYAKWSQLYNINYELNGGTSNPNPTLYKVGDALSLANPERFGYKFLGWYTQESFYGSQIIIIRQTNNVDVTLYAKWEIDFYEMPVLTVDLFDKTTGETYNLSKVNREDYVDAKVSLLNTEDQYLLDNVKSEFRGRGNASWAQEKKGYRFKFNEKLSIFGEEKSKHWVIVPGQKDKTMLRNGLAYSIVNETLDNIEYTTSVNYVEVYINGEYKGVYSFFEHVRVEEGRVDIESEYGVEDTGYLIEYDAYAYSEGVEGINYFKVSGMKYPFTVKSPDPDDYLDEGISEEEFRNQISFIKNYVQKVVNAVVNNKFDDFKNLVDIDSFVDIYLVNELFKTVDFGFSSFNLYKKPQGKLFAGPAWDFDSTVGYLEAIQSVEGLFVAEEVLLEYSWAANEIFVNMMKNINFVDAVKARWRVVSSRIENTINKTINKYSAYELSYQREIDFWYGTSYTWAVEVDKIQTWLLNRINWLNDYWAASIEPREGIVINQIYGGGGKSKTPFSHSFIELYNNSSQEVDLTGWTVVYSSTRNNTNFAGETLNLSGIIPAYTSYLIRGKEETETESYLKYDITAFDLEWADAAIENDAFIHLEIFDGDGNRVDAFSNREGEPLETDMPGKNSKQRSYRRVDFVDTDNNKNDFIMLTWDDADVDDDFINLYRPRSLAEGEWGQT